MFQSEEEIYQQIRQTMEKMFDLKEDDIVAAARLYEDLDVDSIDAVNMIIELRRATGRTIPAERFREARTVGDVVSTVQQIFSSEGVA